MDLQTHHFQLLQDVRYFTLGTLKPDTPVIWMVCHGYGQLARYFIQKFKILSEAGHFIVAPEGLSRFYLKGFNGRVGASWMTSEDRDTDIQNYIQYLSAVKTAAFMGHSAPLNLLGFSQGALTVSRWCITTRQEFNELLLWGGTLPPDLPAEKLTEFLEGKRVSFIYGDQDPLITPEVAGQQEALLKRINADFRVVRFPGKHELNIQVLKSDFLR